MKKRLLSLLLCIMMLITAVPMLATAEDDVPEINLDDLLGEKKFTDVSEGSWYTDAVYYCVDAGFMSGTSDTNFTPHGSMTRAMFVTMLAAYDGVDLAEYTGTSFTDVAEGKWYSAAVEWAYQNKIVSGIGDGVFGYKNTVNRQEIALMLMTYLETKLSSWVSEGAKESFKFSRYADKDDISSWAFDAMSWACGLGLFDAAGNEGDLPVLKPKNTATRAQVALIMKNFDETRNPVEAKLTIAGNDISLYSLVIPESPEEPQEDAANLLHKWIRDAYGVELPIVRDTTEPSEYEIILGKTSREDAGLVTVDRTAEYELYYSVNVQGNRLVIAGTVDAENRRGTLYGAFDVAELAGYRFLSDDMILFDGESHDIPADFDIKDAPGFEYRVVYWPNGWDDVYNNHEDYYPGCNVMVHELGLWVDPSLRELSGNAAYRVPNPCLTDEGNIQKIIDKVFERISKSPNAQSIWVSQTDTWDHCECDRCMEMYNANGGNHSATIINLCNIICEELDKAGYPDFKVMTLAYDYSTAPPTNMVCDDDIIVYYCTIHNCMSCPYESSTCPLNAGTAAEIEKWGEICDKLYVWDYSTNFSYVTVPFPDLYNIRENNEWFYENGVRGVFNNAVASETGEFGSLRAYLYSIVYKDPTMSEEEYFAKMDEYLEAYYGAGWKNIRKFIDLMEEWSSQYHFSCRLKPDRFYDMKYFEANEDMINAMWDEAEALADSEWELENIRRSRLCCTYMLLNATYYKDCQMGTAETRAEWQARAQEFYDEVMFYDTDWAENSDDPKFIITKPPMDWQ